MFLHTTNFRRVFFLMFVLFLSCGKELSVPHLVQNEIIAVLFMKMLFISEDAWWTWKTFDLCFSFNSIFINEWYVVSFFKSLYSRWKKQNSWQPFLISLLSKALRNSVTLFWDFPIIFTFLYSTQVLNSAVRAEKLHSLPLMKPLFVHPTIALKCLAAVCSWLTFSF